jgi:hypothetical protein
MPGRGSGKEGQSPRSEARDGVATALTGSGLADASRMIAPSQDPRTYSRRLPTAC